jgi:hypothetical protein
VERPTYFLVQGIIDQVRQGVLGLEKRNTGCRFAGGVDLSSCTCSINVSELSCTHDTHGVRSHWLPPPPTPPPPRVQCHLRSADIPTDGQGLDVAALEELIEEGGLRSALGGPWVGAKPLGGRQGGQHNLNAGRRSL